MSTKVRCVWSSSVPRFLVLLMSVVFVQTSLAECPPYYTFPGAVAGDEFGVRVSDAGDVDNDNFPDIIVGARKNDAGGTDAGRAYVYSGQTGAIIWTFTGEAAGDNFGVDVSGVGDVNNDGYDDLIIGAPLHDAGYTSSGKIYVYSGLDASLLQSFTGNATGDVFGVAVSDAGDVNNDGYPDVIIGAHQNSDGATGNGYARVYSGQDWSLLYSFTGEASSDKFGFRVSGAGDVDNDNYDDLIVGARYSDSAGIKAGRAYVYSGQTGALIHIFDGEAAGDEFGAGVADAGDIDKDGYDDVIVGAPYNDANGTDAGRAYVFSGQTGALLYTLDGEPEGDYFGFDVTGGSDVDADTYPDLIVTARTNDGGGTDAGRVYLYSGQAGGLLYTFTGKSAGEWFGQDASFAGDVDNDGNTDLLVGAMYATGSAGRADIYLLSPDLLDGGDNAPDICDNCPAVANPGQGDLDADGIGNPCDPLTLLTASATLSVAETFQNLTIPNGVTLTANAEVVVTGNLTIEPGGTIRHSPRNLSGLQLTVGDSLWIQRNAAVGRISVSARGLYGGGRAGCGWSGETYNSSGDIVCGSGGSSGGSHGGVGGTGATAAGVAPAYGVVENPEYLGGGGGCEYAPYNPGGNGGGLVRITAGTVILDGEIRANGETIYPNCGYAYGRVGGGAGGGISISADVFEGSSSGLITAKGGLGACDKGGGGGGGRIAIKADDYSGYAGTYSARGGYSNETQNIASPGTIYLRNSKTDDSVPGAHLVDNDTRLSNYYTPLRTDLDEFESIVIRNGATFEQSGSIVPSITVNEGVFVQSNGRYHITNGSSLTINRSAGPDFDLTGSGIFRAYSGATLTFDQLSITGGTFYTENSLSLTSADGISMSGSSSLQIRESAVFRIPTFDETNIQNGTIDLGSGTSLQIDSDSLRIGNGVTLIKDGQFGDGVTPDLIGSMTILPGGKVTHSVRSLAGLYLEVSNSLWIQRDGSAGQVNVSGCGLLGGGRSSPVGCGDRGETINPSSGAIICGSAGSSGGSHGGAGGTGATAGTVGAIYDLVEAPMYPGGGGGCEYGPYNPGGEGGGLAQIYAGTLIIDGEIRADGKTISPNCAYAYGRVGGGAGGGILIDVGELTGASSGLVSANGGNGACTRGGAGGGGRIAIYAESTSFPQENVTADGGYGDGKTGDPGSILFAGTGTESPDLSTVDDCLIISPAGNIPFEVTLRDPSGFPVEGSLNAWLDFSGVSGLTICEAQEYYPEIPAPSPSDVDGTIRFYIKAGGCSSDSVKIKTAAGIIAEVPIRSLDHNGGLHVTIADFVEDECNDYNNNGIVDGHDWDFFADNLGQTCIENLASFLGLSLYTIPAPHMLFRWDTIQVCAKVTNRLLEAVELDSIVYQNSSFGIAQTWYPFDVQTNNVISPQETVDFCNEFELPVTGHGCFRVTIYPSLASNTRFSRSVFRQGNSKSAEVNTEVMKDCDCDKMDDRIDPCKWICYPTDARCNLLTAMACTKWGTDPSLGCPPFVNCRDHCRCEMCDGVNEACPKPGGQGKAATQSARMTYVPLGIESGDSLQLYIFEFLPDGWSYDLYRVSNWEFIPIEPGWIHTPDTIGIEVWHDNSISPADTGRVIVYAYNDQGEYAGNAEAFVYEICDCTDFCDLDFDGEINPLDIAYIVHYVYLAEDARVQFSWCPGDNGDWNCDEAIDPLDVVWYVNFVYRFLGDGPCDPCGE
ncbi:hypothetical protein ACFLQW_02260 [Candidatus Zixiibacteriota bacterium]